MDDYQILSGLTPEDYPSRSVAVAMSGGVDSSLTAILLKETGFDVVGLTMHLWDYEHSGGMESSRMCCDLSSVESARKIAASAGIPHYVVNLKDEFESCVVEDFITSYLAGKTPNPCVRCNTFIKWHFLHQKARSMGFELLATGHYARIAQLSDGTFSLLTGLDKAKDQSYFLWGLDSPMLAATLFPLGSMTKEETRRESGKRNLSTAHREESQEICFIPDNDYGRFLRFRFGENIPISLTEGSIFSASGEPIGTHPGSAYYTIGQRRGLGIAHSSPLYVTAVDTVQNTITVGERADLQNNSMRVSNVVWTPGFPPSKEFSCVVKIRYRDPGTPAVVSISEPNAQVTFDKPVSAITPGQSAVFYDGDMVLGGGVIEKGTQ